MKPIERMLQERLKSQPSSKVKDLAKKSAAGTLTSFQGLFAIKELDNLQKSELEELLTTFKQKEEQDIANDFQSLVAITSEVKAITNQAALLHGERIKKAQEILKKYKDGAFSQWLVKTYGNRQTPYNLLLYYEFHEELPQELQEKLETIPRQAMYILASRNISLDKKKEIVASYSGETKEEMLEHIRASFPLQAQDKRRSLVSVTILLALEKQIQTFQKFEQEISREDKEQIAQTLKKFLFFVKDSRGFCKTPKTAGF